MSEKGRIDILNTNMVSSETFEDLSLDEIKAQFETNFFGAVRVTQHVLPIMRTARRMAGVVVLL